MEQTDDRSKKRERQRALNDGIGSDGAAKSTLSDCCSD